MSDRFEVGPAFGNHSRRQGTPDSQASDSQEPRRNLKFAIFYLVVAALPLFSNQLAKRRPPGAFPSDPASNVQVDLSIDDKPEPTRVGNEQTQDTRYVIRFRVTNRGNQPIFYPVYPHTNRPAGQIVYRVAPAADWIPENPTSGPSQPVSGGNLAWVEMPPGGWVDGIFDDSSTPKGDHAYELDMKTTDKFTRLFSRPYRVGGN
jgi:hypothetical protein